MREFFVGQLDYVYFIYGTSFFVLAFSCFFLRKDRSSNFPWLYLLLFAVTHGLNEWLDLLSISFGDLWSIATIKIFILWLSYLFLFEFGRLSFNLASKTKITRVIYLLVLPLSLSGTLFGYSNLNATIRYFLGLTGGLLSSYAMIVRAGSEQKRSFRPLFFFGITMAAYSLLTGLIPPATGFFPGNIINNETFLGIFHSPVQLWKGIASIALAFFGWSYFISIAKERTSLSKNQIQRWAIALSCILIGWFLVNFLSEISTSDIMKIKSLQAGTMRDHLVQEIKIYDNTAKTMGNSPFLHAALISRAKRDITLANSTLDRYNSGMGASVCYLLDRKGSTIASSNRFDKDSFVGISYGFRPYFQTAINGQPGYFFGRGVTSKKRGYYSSYPVRDPRGTILGVAVVKKNLDENEKVLKQFDFAFLVDPSGTIFLSSDPQYLSKTVYSIGAQNRESGIFDGKTFKIIKAPTGKEGWSIIVFASTRQIALYRFLGIVIVMLISTILIISFITLGQWELSDLLQLENYKEDLMRMIVHDLKNPLTCMMTATELIGDGAIGTINEKQKEIVEMLKVGEKKILSLVLNILDLKKLEENKYSLQKENFSPEELAKELEWIKDSALQEKKALAFAFENGLTIFADKSILTRVLENLIGNAIKHSYPGGAITCSIKNAEGRVLFEVIDSGEGINKNDLPHIFDSFAVATGQRFTKRFDTGIGLAFCKLAVETHGGTIGVESEIGKGSMFYFFLPKEMD